MRIERKCRDEEESYLKEKVNDRRKKSWRSGKVKGFGRVRI